MQSVYHAHPESRVQTIGREENIVIAYIKTRLIRTNCMYTYKYINFVIIKLNFSLNFVIFILIRISVINS